MNATQTLIIENLTDYRTVSELVSMTGKGETTIRENLKKLIESGDIVKDGKRYMNAPEVGRESVAIEDADREPGDLVEDDDGAPLPNEQQPADAHVPTERRKYQRHIGEKRTQTTRTNQITKAEIGVRASADEPRLAAKYGIATKWFTVCLTHESAVGEDRVKDAHWHSTYPAFCDTCKPQLEGKEGRRRKHGLADRPAA